MAIIISIFCILWAIAILTISATKHFKLLIVNVILLFYCFILGLCNFAGYLDLCFNNGLTGSILTGSIFLLLSCITLRKYAFRIDKSALNTTFNLKIPSWNIAYLPVFIFWTGLLVHYLTSLPGSYDGNAYHLPLAMKFLQSNSFSHLPPIWHFAMPSNAEALFYFFANFHNPVLLNFVQVPLLIAFVVTMHLQNHRFFHMSSDASGLVICCMLMVPAVFQGIFSHYIDLFGTIFLYYSFTALMQSVGKAPITYPRYFFLAGLFFGISVGTKLTFLVFSPLFAAAAGFIIFKNGPYRLDRTILLKTIGACFFGVLLLSSFWYVRNCILFGNPFYPLSVSILGWKGVAKECIVSVSYELRFVDSIPWGWLLYPFTEKHPQGLYEFSFGPVFAVLVLPACIVFLASYLSNRFKNVNRRILFSLVLSLGSLSLWFVCLSRQPRFIIIAIIFAAPALGYVFDSFSPASRRILTWCCAFVFFLTTILAGYELLYTKAVQWRTKHVLDWASTYNLPFTNKEIGDSGIINLVIEEDNFKLYGPEFQNRVYTYQEVLNHYYGRNPTYIESRELPTLHSSELIRLLQASKCSYIFSRAPLSYPSLQLVRTGKNMFPERQWLENYLYRVIDLKQEKPAGRFGQ